jgi:hypothetical protein
MLNSFYLFHRLNGLIYRGCQKTVPVLNRFFLQPLMPHFRISEHYYGKRHKSKKLNQ